MGAGKSIFRGIEAKQVATPGCFADQSSGERANFRVFVFLVPRLVLDRVVENDFSEGNFFLGRVIEQFSGCGFQCREKSFGF